MAERWRQSRTQGIAKSEAMTGSEEDASIVPKSDAICTCQGAPGYVQIDREIAEQSHAADCTK